MVVEYNFSIVLVGENLPVQRITKDDFTFGAFRTTEKMRLPVAFELEAGPFRVIAFPERLQIAAIGAEVSDENITTLQDNAVGILDLVGRRSANSVGLNVDARFKMTKEDHAGARQKLVREEALSTWGVAVDDDFELALRFDAPEADFGVLKVVLPTRPEPVLVVDLNYHFDLTNPKHRRPDNAIHRLPTILDHGVSLIAAIHHSVRASETSEK